MKKTMRIWLALLAALTGLMMLYVTASASPQNGWTTVKGKTYYYENGEKAIVKLHYHTNEPWLVLEYCRTFGEIHDIVVEDMDRQSRGLKG